MTNSPKPSNRKRTFSRRRAIAASLLANAVLASGIAYAGPPSIFDIFRRKPSVPTGSLELSEEHGPWLIMAAVITTDDAQDRATKLAEEIRQEFRIPAFIMPRTSGTPERLGQGERVRVDMQTGQTRTSRVEAKYVNGGAEEGFAVLVGEFGSMDDPQIDEILPELRKYQPKSFTNTPQDDLYGETNTNQAVQEHRSRLWSNNERTNGLSILGRAFVTRNPKLPAEYFLDSPKLDKFVTDLNSRVEFSLLDCPAKYTVRVASFTGKEVTDFGNGARASKMSDETSDILVRAGLRAHQLTTMLRKKNIEAYEFHDRYGSYVTIGSFDSIGKEVNGVFQYNPAMQAVAQKYCGYESVKARNPLNNAVSVTQTLKTEGKIPFDEVGKPMAVPRPSSRVYGGSLLGRR